MYGKKITRQQQLDLLRELQAAEGDWVTVYLRHETVKEHPARLVFKPNVDPRLLEASSLIEDEVLQREMERFGTGLALFHGAAHSYSVVPPFKVSEDKVVTGAPLVEPLRAEIDRAHRTLLVLVTWGAYVSALYEGEKLLHHKKGTGHIHPPHKKGGSSQARFARRTENQRAEFLGRVGAHIDAEFGQEQVEHIYFGGNRLILRPLTKESRFLREHAQLISPRVLLVKKATLDVLCEALVDAYSAILFNVERRPHATP